MDDTELIASLTAYHREGALIQDPPGLREAVLVIPSTTPHQGGWLPSFTGRFQTMFSATKFVVAGVIVALFGGFLLAGVLTQPSDDSAPAVGASASASLESEPANEPTTAPEAAVTDDLLPGVALVTEEVEPGVLRVVNDGVRDLARPLPDYSYPWAGFHLTSGLDGSLWLHGPDGEDKASRHGVPTPPGHGNSFRLGDEQVASLDGDHAPERIRNTEVGPDGTLWMVDDGLWFIETDPPRKVKDPDDVMVWEPQQGGGGVGAYALDPDGAVWAVSEALGTTLLARSYVGSADWRSEEWPWPVTDVNGLWATDAGEIWFWQREPDAFGRFDGSEWQRHDVPDFITPPGEFYGSRFRSVDVGPDGTLWASLDSGDCSGLVRFDGTDWTEFGKADGVPNLHGYELPSLFSLAPDGSVWVNPKTPFNRDGEAGCPSSSSSPSGEDKECGGLHNFDGTTWSRFLQGTCIYDMDIARDGTVWARGGTFDLNADPFGSVSGPVEVYVITPEAVAATE
jgi:hypothetical protein